MSILDRRLVLYLPDDEVGQQMQHVIEQIQPRYKSRRLVRLLYEAMVANGLVGADASADALLPRPKPRAKKESAPKQAIVAAPAKLETPKSPAAAAEPAPVSRAAPSTVVPTVTSAQRGSAKQAVSTSTQDQRPARRVDTKPVAEEGVIRGPVSPPASLLDTAPEPKQSSSPPSDPAAGALIALWGDD